jgi:predicted nucleotidyltransferase
MSDNYIDDLIKTLKELKPYKAILFGSYAWGKPHEDSDIDLIVVLNKDKMPESYAERMKNYFTVIKYFRMLNKKVPMDIIVYTKAEWNKLLEIKSSFSKEILSKGKVLV